MSTEFQNHLGTAVAVSLTENRMRAYIQLLDPEAAAFITKPKLIELLRHHRVVSGIHEDALDQFVLHPLHYTQQPLLVASGVEPGSGEDGYIRKVIGHDSKEKRPRQKEDGTVDFRDMNQLDNVLKGQLIAQRVPATKGSPGMTVTGETIPGKDGREARFKVGRNVVVDAEKMNMYAVIDGLVTETENGKLNVFPVYEVNGDVDYRVGNIDFVGNVVIRGNVLSGFKVKASGDIRITGGVEGAEVEAEGSVDIASGIFAGNKGFVKAGVNVRSLFMQEANVFAGQHVIVNQSILHSTVRAGKTVVCKGSKGLIVGGSIQAGELIQARTVGNSTSTATSLEVGVAPELRQELLQLRAALKTVVESIDKAEKALHLLDQLALSGGLSPEKQELRTKLLSTKRTSGEELSRLKERIWEIESSLDDVEKARVEILGAVYPGTKIVIGRYTRFVKDATKHVQFRMLGGEIAMTSLA